MKPTLGPIDEEVFLYCVEVYQAAATMIMPTKNPETVKIELEDYGTLAFTDRKENRGMLAIMKEARQAGLSDHDRMSLGWRILHVNNVIEARVRFARWIKDGDEPGALAIDEALLRACARAKTIYDPNSTESGPGFDLDDVERIAAEMSDREAAGNKT
jgi:hypothetical protein